MKQTKGRGGAGGLGAGNGGSVSDGSRMSGMMRQNIPIFGPSRMQFGEASLAYGEYRPGRKSGRAMETAEGSQLESANHENGPESQLETDTIPLKYKEAVKKYFSSPTTK